MYDFFFQIHFVQRRLTMLQALIISFIFAIFILYINSDYF